jgi:hypothetical protein
MIFVFMFAVWFFGAGLWSIFILPKGGRVGQNNESIFCYLAWTCWVLAQVIFLGWITTLNWNSAEFLFSSEGHETSLVLTLMWFDVIWGRASSQAYMNIAKGFKNMAISLFENVFFVEPPSKVARRQKAMSEEW